MRLKDRKPMKGKVLKEIPGYLTPPQVAKRFGMARAQLYQSGLAEAMNRYRVGKSNATLYKEDDVAKMEHWLRVRRGLIGMGVFTMRHPLVPTNEEFRAALAGQWDATCPVCGGEAVRDPDTGRIWCPDHGVIEPEVAGEAEDER